MIQWFRLTPTALSTPPGAEQKLAPASFWLFTILWLIALFYLFAFIIVSRRKGLT